MKKVSIFVTVLVLVVVAAGAPLLTGTQAEKEINRFVESVNASSDYQVQVTHYEKNYLDSKTTLVFSVKNEAIQQAFEGSELVLPVDLVINHGPWVRSELGAWGVFSYSLTLQDKQEGWLKSHITTEVEGPVYQMQGIMDFSEHIVFKERILPFTASHDDFSLSASGYEGSGSYSKAKQLHHSATLPKLEFAFGEEVKGSIVGSDLKTYLDMTNIESKNFIPGDVEWKTAEFSVVGEKSIKVSDFFTKMDTQVKDSIANISMLIGVENASIDDGQSGKFEIDMAYKNLDIKIVDEIFAELEKHTAGDVPEANQHMQDLLANKFIPSSPGFSVDRIYFSTHEGEFNGSLDLSILGEKAKTSGVDFNNPFAMIPLIEVSANVDMDRKLADWAARENTRKQALASLELEGVEKTDEEIDAMVDAQAPMMLQMLVMQGLIVEEGAKLTSNFEFKEGLAKINGNDMPLPF